ncbi:mucin-binding protein [Weissella viridescens]|uniref:mucin-binding protein n=1 Tax=Weissella viridescens TaxID=1629 RepID=UPI003AF2A67D
MKTKQVNVKTLGTLFVGVGVSFGISYALQQPAPASAMELPAWAEKIPMAERIAKTYRFEASQVDAPSVDMGSTHVVQKTVAQAQNQFIANKDKEATITNVNLVSETPGAQFYPIGGRFDYSFDNSAGNMKKGDLIRIPLQIGYETPGDVPLSHVTIENKNSASFSNQANAFSSFWYLQDDAQNFTILSRNQGGADNDNGLVIRLNRDLPLGITKGYVKAKGNNGFATTPKIENNVATSRPIKIFLAGKQVNALSTTWKSVPAFAGKISQSTGTANALISGGSGIQVKTDTVFNNIIANALRGKHDEIPKELATKPIVSGTIVAVDDTILNTAKSIALTATGIVAPNHLDNGIFHFNQGSGSLPTAKAVDFDVSRKSGESDQNYTKRMKVLMEKQPANTFVNKVNNQGQLVYMYNGGTQSTGFKLKDGSGYKNLGATSATDYFHKRFGLTWNATDEKKINEVFDKYPIGTQAWASFVIADKTKDHTVKAVGFNNYTDELRVDTPTFTPPEVNLLGQGAVKWFTQDSHGNNIKPVDQDVDWTTGSKDNPDKQATREAPIIQGKNLAKTTVNGKTVSGVKQTVPYPDSDAPTSVIRTYRDLGKFTTDNPTAKANMPAYKTDKADSIKPEYTIPYVKGKKAQGPDGKLLKLVDPKDKNKGYVAPTIADKFNDTRINYVADEGTVKIEYFDATANKVVQTDSETGIVDEKAKYTTDATIKKWVGQGYVLKSDHYPKGFTFVDGKPVYRVDFEQGTTKHTPSDPKGMDLDKLRKVVSQTIVYQNYKTKQPMAGLKDNKQQVVFDKEIVTNNVTNKVVSETAFKAQKTSYQAVNSPKVNGWVAKQLVVPAKENVAPTDGDTKIVVSYVQGEQKGTVTYVNDDRDGKVLAVDALVGKSGEQSAYTTKAQLEKLYALGYELVKDEYPEQGLTFDSDDTKDQNFVEHLGERKSPITPDKPGQPGQPFDPKYPDGVKWPAGTDALKLTKQRQIDYVFKGQEDKNYSKTETRDLSRKGIVNHVTGETKYDEYGQVDKFKQVVTPEVDGWTADKDAVAEVTVDEKTPELTHEVVTYEKNPEQKVTEKTDKQPSEQPDKAEDKADKPEAQKVDKQEPEPKQAEQAAAEKPEEAKPKDVAANTGESTPLTDIWMAIQKLLHFDLGK